MKHIHNRLFFATDILLLPLAAYFSFALRIDSWSLGTYWRGYILDFIGNCERVARRRMLALRWSFRPRNGNHSADCATHTRSP